MVGSGWPFRASDPKVFVLCCDASTVSNPQMLFLILHAPFSALRSWLFHRGNDCNDRLKASAGSRERKDTNTEGWSLRQSAKAKVPRLLLHQHWPCSANASQDLRLQPFPEESQCPSAPSSLQLCRKSIIQEERAVEGSTGSGLGSSLQTVTTAHFIPWQSNHPIIKFKEIIELWISISHCGLREGPPIPSILKDQP